MKRILLVLLSISFSLPAAERPPQPPKKSRMELLPSDIQFEEFKYATWSDPKKSLSELDFQKTMENVKRYYIAHPAAKNDVALTKKILAHLMKELNVVKGKDLQDIIEQLEKMGDMKALADKDLKKWIGEQKKRMFYEDELRAAIKDNDADKVDALITKGVNINAEDSLGIPIFQYIEFETDYSKKTEDAINRILLSLIRAGADINAASDIRELLYFAIEHGNVSSVKILLDKGAIIHDHDLEAAIRGFLFKPLKRPNYRLILTMLLEKGANPNIQIKEGVRSVPVKDLIRSIGSLGNAVIIQIKAELLDLLRKHGLKE